jgi:hypothetical protein
MPNVEAQRKPITGEARLFLVVEVTSGFALGDQGEAGTALT